jgi:hypothetical protein
MQGLQPKEVTVFIKSSSVDISTTSGKLGLEVSLDCRILSSLFFGRKLTLG